MGAWCFLEHPEDPKLCSKSPNASRCSTIWQTQAVRSWCKSLGLSVPAGTMRGKIHCSCHGPPTAQLGRPILHPWEHRKPSGVTSSDLSRHPPHTMQGIAQAVLVHTQSTSSPSPHEDRAYSLQSSVVGAWGPLGTLRTDLRLHQPREVRLCYGF